VITMQIKRYVMDNGVELLAVEDEQGVTLNDPADSWLPVVDYPHRVHVQTSPIGESGWRYARVLKTVAYIVTDEDDYGQPVIEKWDVKRHTTY